jgi:peptidyl-tRNA hydrolase
VDDDSDPLVMYLVVRRRTARPFAELAVAAALAARRCATRYRDDERWRAGFDDWWRHSFRKVCLRAEPREWEDVRLLDHERVGDVVCLPPVRRSTRDRVLVRMQALSDEAGALPGAPAETACGLTLAVRTDLGMSAGKAIAQIGHGALMAPLDVDLDPGRTLCVVGATGESWDRVVAAADTVVRDGGLTEIAAGSETVAVIWRDGAGG